MIRLPYLSEMEEGVHCSEEGTVQPSSPLRYELGY